MPYLEAKERYSMIDRSICSVFLSEPLSSVHFCAWSHSLSCEFRIASKFGAFLCATDYICLFFGASKMHLFELARFVLLCPISYDTSIVPRAMHGIYISISTEEK